VGSLACCAKVDCAAAAATAAATAAAATAASTAASTAAAIAAAAATAAATAATALQDHQHRGPWRLVNGDASQLSTWAQVGRQLPRQHSLSGSHAFVLMMEVLDNLPHDRWAQGLVQVDVYVDVAWIFVLRVLLVAEEGLGWINGQPATRLDILF
jgi:hypothetical protein